MRNRSSSRYRSDLVQAPPTELALSSFDAMDHVSQPAKNSSNTRAIQTHRSASSSSNELPRCGKWVSFMWKNCRKDVALTFDFYTNSRIGCCSFEEIDLVGCSIRREHDTTSTAEQFRQRVLSTGCWFQIHHLLLLMVRPAATKISLFGGCIRGQEKSWGNEEEGSQEGC